MRHPFQCLVLVPPHKPKLEGLPQEQSGQLFLLAGCGSQLFNLDFESGDILSRWPPHEAKNGGDNSDSSTEIITGAQDSNGQTKRKRRRISSKHKASADANIGGAIIRLIVSKNGQFAVAATDEDKMIHVIGIDRSGLLEHLSQRRMAKRPCAIALTPKEDFILVGDKFGDVYALPLQHEETIPLVGAQKGNGHASKQTVFTPSATNLTVHTQRNLQALKNQMLQQQTSGSKAKEGMNFAHDLLLGHVSMLTDLASVSVPSPDIAGSMREYIITCDRDEHVRVSRGRQQAHIIENYCFGHTQFVSKLCLLNHEPSVLVSGGGDNYLFVWDWLQGRLLGKLPIQQQVQSYLRSLQHNQAHASNDPRETKQDELPAGSGAIAVSGLWPGTPPSPSQLEVWCACQGVAAVFGFTFQLDEKGLISEQRSSSSTYKLPGNALALARTRFRTVVAVDTVHAPESTTAVRQNASGNEEDARLVQFTSFMEQPTWTTLSIDGDHSPSVTRDDLKKLGSLLYGVEHLRKHSNEELD